VANLDARGLILGWLNTGKNVIFLEDGIPVAVLISIRGIRHGRRLAC
jgi:hypothetical protein